MIDKKGAQNLLDQIKKIWIEPELSRRQHAKSLPENFMIFGCLIKLPKDRPPIIEFNDEIRWIASVKICRPIEKGMEVYIHDVREICAVSPPEVNGQRVAFVHLFWTGHAYQIVFDFTPNVPAEMISEEERAAWHFEKTIAESLQAILTEKVIRIHDSTQKLLQNNGLWAAPALLPYPLSRIIMELEKSDTEGAFNTLREYCTSEFIEKLSYKWWAIEQFNERQKLILEAMHAHKEGKFQLSVYALLPQIEGIITDWVYTKLPEKEIPWRQESKTMKFRDLVLDKPLTTFTYKRIVDSTIDFIIGGPPLKIFERWLDEIDKAFPNRHVVLHGKYDESIFTKENSIKLFLMIDTVYHIISAQLEIADISNQEFNKRVTA